MNISAILSAVFALILMMPASGLAVPARKTSAQRTTQSIPSRKDSISSTAKIQSDRSKSLFTLIPVIEAGTSSSNTEQPPLGSMASLAGPAYSFGLLTEIGPRDLKFQAGLMYLTDAYNLTFDVTSRDSGGNKMRIVNAADTTLHFIGVPLLAKFNVGVKHTADRVFLRAGVTPAMLLSRSGKAGMEFYTNDSLTTRYDQPVTDISRFRDLNVFATLGAGAEFDIDSRSDWRVEASYRRMLLSATGSNPSSFSGSFLLSLAFGYAL